MPTLGGLALWQFRPSSWVRVADSIPGTSEAQKQHGLKIVRRFEEDIWGVLATSKKSNNVLNFVYEAYQNNFKYKKLLKDNKKAFFLAKRRGKFLYKITTDEKEFKRKRRSLKINNYLNLLKLTIVMF